MENQRHAKARECRKNVNPKWSQNGGKAKNKQKWRPRHADMLHLCSETEKRQNHGKPCKSGFFAKLGQKVITRRAPRKLRNEPEFIKRVQKEEYGKEISFY